MDSSGYTRPSTAEHARRGQAPGRPQGGGEDQETLTPDSEEVSEGGAGQDGVLVRAYERFLELPVALVLAVMWLAGVALLGSCALAVYLLGSLLLQVPN